MDKNTQRKIWNENHGYKGKNRKWAYRRSKRAIRALCEAAVYIEDVADMIPEAALALPKGPR